MSIIIWALKRFEDSQEKEDIKQETITYLKNNFNDDLPNHGLEIDFLVDKMEELFLNPAEPSDKFFRDIGNDKTDYTEIERANNKKHYKKLG